MLARQGYGRGGFPGSSRDVVRHRPGGVNIQPNVPARFMLIVKDFSSDRLKLKYGIGGFTKFCQVIIFMIEVFCNVLQIFYSPDGLPTVRTIVITDQIVWQFMHFGNAKYINEQLSPPFPRRETIAQFEPPFPFDSSHFYPNPFLEVSFAMKVANKPSSRQTFLGSQYPNVTYLENPFPLLDMHRVSSDSPLLPFPYAPPMDFPIPRADSFTIHEAQLPLPPPLEFYIPLLNMMMDPGKGRCFIKCSRID